MQNRTPLRALQAGDHFEKKLVAKIDKLNQQLAACDADEASAERELAGLLGQALNGELEPAAAAARFTELTGQLHAFRTGGSIWDVERLKIAEARESLRPLYAEAHKTEAAKCTQAAEERARFLREQLTPLMAERAVETSVRADPAWLELSRQAQRWSAQAGSSVNSHEDHAAIEETRRRLAPAGGTVPGAMRSPFKRQ